MKPPKPLKQAHTSNSKFGMGDYHGTAIKQKVGRVRDNYMDIPIKNNSKPPKSLA